ncbi:UDP-N-acetylmuramyl peptide synthase [Bifidobacterium favimelis]|uniref:UDP-N-acetylmuramyl peptide synthase n=1 Tax=Bifidobacterium favimelis TaxID=3122979 RepID=A0ABU8ZQI2_9BIFI
MSALSESISRRMTLGYLKGRYGLTLVPSFAEPVTITSLADDLPSVRPGCLYVPSQTPVEEGMVDDAEWRGAYAALLPLSARKTVKNARIPVLFGTMLPSQMGQLLSNAAGDPSGSLAVFGLVGEDETSAVDMLGDFLHVLGNPVGILSCKGSYSLDRQLDLHYPLSMFDVQRCLSISLEDGAAAVVIDVSDRTLQADAMQSVDMDVVALGAEEGRTRNVRHSKLIGRARHFGFTLGGQTNVARRTEESDSMARQSLPAGAEENVDELSLCIAMTMAAGVKRNNIRSALRVSREIS